MTPSDVLKSYMIRGNYTDQTLASMLNMRTREIQLAILGVSAIPPEKLGLLVAILNPQPEHITYFMKLSDK